VVTVFEKDIYDMEGLIDELRDGSYVPSRIGALYKNFLS
jgi:hypothetical protein